VCKIIESGNTLSALSEVYRILEASEEKASKKVWFYLCLVGDVDLRMRMDKSLSELAFELRSVIQGLQSDTQENQASAKVAAFVRHTPVSFGIIEE
jgi:hypothetical protein